MQRKVRLRWHLTKLRVRGVYSVGRAPGFSRSGGGRLLRWPIARLQLRDRPFQGREQKAVHGAAIAEADFMLGRMHVDIDQRGIEEQIKYAGGVPAVIQNIAAYA